MILLVRLLLSLVLSLALSLNAEAVITYTASVCSSGCEFTLFSSAEDALDNAGDIRHTGSVKCGSWDNQSGSDIANATAVTWDAGASSGTLHNMTTSQYLLTVSSGTLDDNDTVTDGTNSFQVNGTPDHCAIDIQCQGNETISETVATSMNGFTTDSDNNVRFSVGATWRHNGTASTGCTISSNATSVINLADSNAYIQWLVIKETLNSASNTNAMVSLGSSDTEMYIDHVIIADPINPGAGTISYGIDMAGSTSGSTTFATNNIIYGGTETTSGILENSTFGRTIEADNNSIYNFGNKGIISGSANGTTRAKNNLSIGTTSGDYSGSFDTFTTNGSGDTSGTSGLQSLVASTEWSNPGTDMHLKSGATSINAGTDLVTTPTGVNYDIDNRDRDALADTWDLGADEFVAAAGRRRTGLVQ